MRIMVSIAGFKGPPVTLLGLYKEETRILVLARQVEFNQARIAEDMAVVSNIELPAMDFRFSEKEHLKLSIDAYFARRSIGSLSIPDALNRHTPDNKIEPDSVDEGGIKYRVSGDIDNGQIAVLAMVAYAEQFNPISSAIEAFSDLLDEDEFFTV